MPRADGGLGGVHFPLLSDLSHNISKDYGTFLSNFSFIFYLFLFKFIYFLGVLADAGFALRGTFIIDDKQVLRHVSINDTSVGRNVDEIYRLV
jgi:peroxiredoxin (alkyl hydroperoxide reductase subunit C)